MKDFINLIIFAISAFVMYHSPVDGFWWNVVIFAGTWEVTSIALAVLAAVTIKASKEEANSTTN